MSDRTEENRDKKEAGQRGSSRQREIEQLLRAGKSDKEVADALGISVRTVEAYRAAFQANTRWSDPNPVRSGIRRTEK